EPSRLAIVQDERGRTVQPLTRIQPNLAQCNSNQDFAVGLDLDHKIGFAGGAANGARLEPGYLCFCPVVEMEKPCNELNPPAGLWNLDGRARPQFDILLLLAHDSVGINTNAGVISACGPY